MTIGERIKIARRRAGLTQAKLAEKLEVSLMTIRRWESGIREPSNEVLDIFAETFKSELSDLPCDEASNAPISANGLAYKPALQNVYTLLSAFRVLDEGIERHHTEQTKRVYGELTRSFDKAIFAEIERIYKEVHT